MLKVDKLALGMLELIYQAIQDHKKRHFGDRPLRIELHPALEFPLLMEIDAKDFHLRGAFLDALRPNPRYTDVKGPSLFNVPLVWTRQARFPRLITVNNATEHL